MTTFPPTGGSSTPHMTPPDEHRVRGGHAVAAPPWTGVSGQWGAIVAGAFTGLAVAVVMTTLGAALGFTGGAIAASSADVASATADDAARAATGAGIGAGIWLLVTAAAVGLAGGGVLAKMSRIDRSYVGSVLGVVTWACGLTMAVLLAAIAGGGALTAGLAAGIGAGGAAAAGAASSSVSMESIDSRSNRDAGSERESAGVPAEASARRTAPEMTPAQRAEAREVAEATAKAAATAVWFALIAQLIGLGATMFAASRRKPETVLAR